MATWYLDPVNGVDANAGTSFATRVATIAGINGKAIAAGDTIRVIASPEPQTTSLTGECNMSYAINSISAAVAATITNCDGLYTRPGYIHQIPWTGSGWTATAYGAGKFIALQYGTKYAAWSIDGITWTRFDLPVSSSWQSIVYGNGMFIAISYGSAIAITSTDGITWTQRALSSSRNWNAIAYGNGTFVAVASGTNIGSYSTDGITWTDMTMSANTTWVSVSYGAGVFVAVSLASGTIAASSSDGITWTARTMPATATWKGVTYGNGMFMAISTTTTVGAKSTDGITWSSVTMPTSGNKTAIVWNGAYFVWCQSSSTAAYYSTDGTTWGTLVLPSSTAWQAMATNGSGLSLFIAGNGTSSTWDNDTRICVGSTNVTASHLGTAKIEGGASAQFVIAAGFTTGLVGYIPCNDGAGFDRVTLKIRQSAGTLIAASTYTITLCSDVAGTTPVYTIPVPAVKALNPWVTVSFDLGATLSAGVIKSIGINRLTNPGAQTIQIDNIVSCNASGVLAINHESLVATQLTGPWYPIQNIQPTTIHIAQSPSGSQSGGAGTYEIGTHSLYFRQPIMVPAARQGTSVTDTTWGAVSKAGTVSNYINYSGGWDTTDMSTQTGTTYISGGNGFGIALSHQSNKPCLSFDKINLVNWGHGFYMSGTGSNFTVNADDICGMSGNSLYGNFGGGLGAYLIFDIKNLHSNITSGVNFLSGSNLLNSTFNFNYIVNNYSTGANFSNVLKRSNVTINNCRNNSVHNVVFSGGVESTFYVGNAEFPGRNTVGQANIGVQLSTLSKSKVYVGTVSNPGNTAQCLTVGNCVDVDLTVGNLTGTDQNGYYAFQIGAGNNNVRVRIEGTLLPANQYGRPYINNTSSDITFINTNYAVSTLSGSIVTYQYQNYGGVTGDCRIYDNNGTILTDTTVRNTASGISWKMTPTSSSLTASGSCNLTLARLYLLANTTTTVSLYMRRSDVAAFAGLRCAGGQLTGIPNDVFVETSNAINTWTQYSITLTPTESGVVLIQGYGYGGGGTANVWFDDLSIS